MVETNTKKVYHAGVLCSDLEIIHFTQRNHKKSFSSCSNFPEPSSSSCRGFVMKVGVDDFADGNKFAIYRKEGGIPKSFEKNVINAMTERKLYNICTYNCIHFAMELLEVKYE